jgi:hypothetical protein
VIVYDQDDGSDLYSKRIRSEGGEPNIVYCAPTTLGVLALVAAGLGTAVVPDTTEQIATPGISFRPLLDPEVSLDLLLLSRASKTSGAVNTFLTIARAGILLQVKPHGRRIDGVLLSSIPTPSTSLMTRPRYRRTPPWLIDSGRLGCSRRSLCPYLCRRWREWRRRYRSEGVVVEAGN